VKIAVFADTFYPTTDGVVSSMVSTARELARLGHFVKFFVPRPPKKFLRDERIKDLDVHFVRSMGLLTYSKYRVSLPVSFSARKSFEQFKPDIVHVHTPFSLGWMGLRLARVKGIPVVATYHTLLPEFLMYLPIPIFNRSRMARDLTWGFTVWFYNQADLVTTPTSEMAKELNKHGIEAVPLSNPIQFSLFNRFAKTKKDPDEFRMVFFGRLSFEKNIEVLIDALSILRQKEQMLRLVLVGEGPAEDFLRKRAKEKGVFDFVEFSGVLRGDALAQKVASCHCCVTASTMETQGLTILEAMAAGLPCVGADFLGIPAAVKENKNGFLFPPFRSDICAEKIEKLMLDRKLHARLSKNALATARPLSEEKIVKQYLEIYQGLVKEKKKAAKKIFRKR